MQSRASALTSRKRLVASVFRAYSSLLDRLNRVPLFVKFIRKTPDARIFPDRMSLYQFISDSVGTGPIDYLEFGVHEGESIRRWSELNVHRESRFVGFDSFEGLPEAWHSLDPGAFSTGGAPPKIDDARVTFVCGWFQDTLADFLEGFVPKNRLVINNDSDLYSSTLYTLTKLDHLLVPGTIIVFDEFDDVQHEFRAMDDYASAYRRTFKMLAATRGCRTAAFEIS